MKSKKSNINILAIFMILAIIGLLIYVILYNRNKKSNPTTNYTNTSWDWIVLVPKDPDSISIGFSSIVDKNTGNINLNESINALEKYRMNHINGGKNIIEYTSISDEYLNSVRITKDEFSSNSSAIAITNVILPENGIYGNIPYPGKDLTMYVLNKITKQMNSYNLSRLVTYNKPVDTSSIGDYNIGDIILKPIITNTQLNYTIQNVDIGKSPPQPAIITFL